MGELEKVPAVELAELLSTERLDTYQRHAPTWGCSPIALYLPGARLASSYHHDLSIVEVVLRNALNDSLTEVYGSRWWANGDFLDDRGQEAVAKAHKEVGEGPPGRVIAALPMGFWVHLLGHGDYVGRKPFRERRSYDQLLWRPALRHAFPTHLECATRCTAWPAACTPCGTGSRTVNRLSLEYGCRGRRRGVVRLRFMRIS